MRYRNPETGEVFETIEKARKEYCEGKKFCSECQFSCLLFAERHPAEAARLMGYEVIDDSSTEIDETPTDAPTTLDDTPTVSGDRPTKEDDMDKLDKPLSEWTLGEVQALCKKRNGDGCCDNCPFANVIGNCTLRVLPEEWDLKDAPRLTESEIAIMRAVGAKWVSRNQIGMNSLHLWDKRPGGDKNFWNGDAKSLATVAEFLFPSVKPGKLIKLEEAEK